MSQHDHQRISELIDCELPERDFDGGDARAREALFDRMLADDGAHCAWQRYHLIGCVLRGEVERAEVDLSARIRARLEQEPTVLAPPRRSRWQAARWRPRRFPIGGGLALAASLALVAVIAWQPNGDSARDLTQVAPQTERAAPAGRRFQQEVGEMLAQHGEFASAPGLSGLVVYAKLVSDAPIHR